MRRLLWYSGALLSVLLVGLFSYEKVHWIGGFSRCEFQIQFLDGQGKPLQGVELQVWNALGKDSFHRPAADYTPENRPVSDASGTLIFHQLDSSFGGTYKRYFWLLKTGEHAPPKYTYRFVYQGAVVWTVDCQMLNHELLLGQWPTRKEEWRPPRDSIYTVTYGEDLALPVVRKEVRTGL